MMNERLVRKKDCHGVNVKPKNGKILDVGGNNKVAIPPFRAKI